MRFGALLILGTAFGGMAQAEVTCRFDTECVEAEACGESAFELRYVDPADPGSARLALGLVASTEFGDLAGYTLGRDGDAVRYAFEGPGALYLLSRAPEGARLSVHMEGPMVVTYLGRCEGR